MAEQLGPITPNFKDTAPKNQSVIDWIKDQTRRTAGKIRTTFVNYNLWKEIETHEWNKAGAYKSSVKAREWLAKYVLSKDVHYKRKMLRQGGLFIFDYDTPKYEDVLSFFDSEPLIISLGSVKTKEGLRDIGLNLHLLPPKIRRVVMFQVWEMYRSKYRGQLYHKDQKDIQVEWKRIAAPLEKFGIGFCIRMYIPELRKNVIEVHPEYWKDAIFIQSKGLRKITLSKLEEEWRKFINKSGNKRLNESWTRN